MNAIRLVLLWLFVAAAAVALRYPDWFLNTQLFWLVPQLLVAASFAIPMMITLFLTRRAGEGSLPDTARFSQASCRSHCSNKQHV